MSQLRNSAHPLVRDGKSQDDRLRDSRALMPETIQLDSRSEKSLLAYLYEFAKAVAHYDSEDGQISNWQDFFRSGASVQLARIHAFDASGLQAQFVHARTRLEQGLAKGDFRPLLDFLFETVSVINDWHQGLANDLVVVDDMILQNVNPLQQKIAALVATNLRLPLSRLIATANSIGNYTLPDLSALRESSLFWDDKIEAGRQLAARDPVLQRLVPRPSRFRATVLRQLTDIFGVLQNTVLQIVTDAGKEDILQPTQVHEPHLGLLYTFLRLFSHVQADFNDLTRRHLNFYYNKVLGLQARPYTPDAAHLLFELNKPYVPFKLDPDARILDGKDGKTDIEFGLSGEIVVTRTRIASLRSLYHGDFSEMEGPPPTLRETKKLFAAPVADSADGLGGTFKDTDDTSWPTLGDAATRPVSTGAPVAEMPAARVGLLVASPALRLAEGLRTITLTLPLSAPPSSILPLSLPTLLKTAATFVLTKKAIEVLKAGNMAFQASTRPVYIPDTTRAADMEAALIDAWKIIYMADPLRRVKLPAGFIGLLEKTGVFDIWLTGKKGWFRATNVTFDITTAPQALKVDIILGVKDDPVIPADPVVLKADFKVAEPLLKLELNQALVWQYPMLSSSRSSFYDLFSTAQLGAIQLKVKATGIRSMVVRNDDGLLDASKSFMPFGAQPAVGSSWYVGSDEAFRKDLDDLTLNLEWDKLPQGVNFPDYYEAYLEVFPGISPAPDASNLLFQTRQLAYGVFDDTHLIDAVDTTSNVADNRLFTPNSGPPVSGRALTFKKFYPEGRLTDLLPLTDLNGRTASGFLKITSRGDFLHRYYGQVVAGQAMSAAKKALTDDDWKELKNNIIGSITCTNTDCDTRKKQLMDAIDTHITNIGADPVDAAELGALKTGIQNIGCTDPGCASQVQKAKEKIDEFLKKTKLPPNPPYTPVIKSLTLDYTAYDTEGTPDTGMQVWHLHPFEETNRSLRSESGGGLVPRYVNVEKENRQLQGSLLLGLQYAKPGEVADILFQLHEPSADAYLPQASVQWHYLIGNTWHPLVAGKHLLSDDTEGLIRSGVLRLIVPFDIDTSGTTLLPPPFFWLRVSTTDPTDTICRAVGVHLQAAKTVFRAKEANNLSRPGRPLPAGSLKKFATPPPELKPPKQPYESFGGRAVEQPGDFYRRVSERLRHKGRAVTIWDYEQIVLETFPDIFKVKCIPHTLAERRTKDAHDRPLAPGHVTLVVVPNLMDRPFADRLEPKVSRGRLAEIGHFLAARISPFVRLSVMNPIFERIGTNFKVKFLPGKSPEFYKNQLAADMERYLAPWAYGEQGKLTFGGRVLRSSLLGFIEQRDYVDYVTDFKMFRQDASSTTSVNEITTTAVRGILVSNRLDHTIEVLDA